MFVLSLTVAERKILHVDDTQVFSEHRGLIFNQRLHSRCGVRLRGR